MLQVSFATHSKITRLQIIFLKKNRQKVKKVLLVLYLLTNCVLNLVTEKRLASELGFGNAMELKALSALCALAVWSYYCCEVVYSDSNVSKMFVDQFTLNG